ncbi:MAG TPA: hypothetical protein VJC06_03495 [Candidatus Paceibacterota bacterium]
MEELNSQNQIQNVNTPEFRLPHGRVYPKLIWLIISIVFLSSIAYAGIWFASRRMAEQVVPTFTPRPSATPDPTADWKTYMNTKYGFTVKYPESYFTFHTSGDSNISFRSTEACKLLENGGGEWPTDCQAYDVLVQQNKISGPEMSKTFVAGIEAEKFSDLNGQWSNGTQVLVQFQKGQNWYIQTFTFNTAKSQVSEIIMNQILSTFKFTSITPSTSLTPTPSAGWRTFKDSQSRFEIQYPGNINLDYSNQYPSGDYRVFGVNNVGPNSPIFYLSLYAKPLQNPLDEIVLCREAGGFYIRQYHTDERIIIGGTSHVKCLYDRELQKDQVLVVSFNANGYTWQFIATYYDTYHAIIDQILSTFKFTK